MAAVLLAALTTAAARKPPKGVNINRAEATFALGEFSEADAMAAALLEAEPESFRALHLRGQVAVLENRLDEARGFLERALALRPTHRATRELLAESLYRQDRFAEAAPLFDSLAEEVKAKKLAAFAGREPYRIVGDRAVLPFLETDPLPVVELTIDGEPGAFIVDTGGGELLLDREWARELGIESVGVTRGTFEGDRRADVDHGFVAIVGLGDSMLHDVPITMLDTSPLSRVAPGHDIRGVLGTIFLYHFRSTLDYPAGRLVLEPRVAAPHPATAPAGEETRIRFWMAGDHLLLARGRVNDSDPALLLVDTGLAGAAFTCPEATLKKAGIELSSPPVAGGVGGGGEVAVVPFLLERLSLGELVRYQMPGLFGPFPESLEHAEGFRIGGLVSHAFFRPYAVTFDFESMEIVVRGVKSTHRAAEAFGLRPIEMSSP